MSEKSDITPDLRGPAVIVTGEILSGFKFTGPFATIDKAAEWWGRTLPGHLGLSCSIVLLEDPSKTWTGDVAKVTGHTQ